MSSKQALCPFCGQPVDEGMRCCPFCGAPLSAGEDVAVDAGSHAAGTGGAVDVATHAAEPAAEPAAKKPGRRFAKTSAPATKPAAQAPTGEDALFSLDNLDGDAGVNPNASAGKGAAAPRMTPHLDNARRGPQAAGEKDRDCRGCRAGCCGGRGRWRGLEGRSGS